MQSLALRVKARRRLDGRRCGGRLERVKCESRGCGGRVDRREWRRVGDRRRVCKCARCSRLFCYRFARNFLLRARFWRCFWLLAVAVARARAGRRFDGVLLTRRARAGRRF